MLLKYLELGKIVSTHGVRGELRVQAWCDSYEFFSAFKKVYVGKREMAEYNVVNSRPHGNVMLLTLEGVNTLELANELRNKTLFVRREDAPLPDNRYFIAELIGCRVLDSDNEKKEYGEITDVSNNGASDIWHIKRDGVEYLFPSTPDTVVSVDVEKCVALIRPIRGIFDEGEEIHED